MRVKKTILMVTIVVGLAATVVGGMTMAFFADADETGPVHFQAGTVLIEADSSYLVRQYFDHTEVFYVWGIEPRTGDIYQIDPLRGEEFRVFESPLTSTHGNYPNALAFDQTNNRLYFTQSATKLYFWEFGDSEPTFAGDLVYDKPSEYARNAYGATFGDGAYWFIPNSTADLYRVDLKPDGTIDSHTKTTMTDDYTVSFGDFVYLDGVIYGSSSGHQADLIYFIYDIDADVFTVPEDHDATAMQTALGHDGDERVLFGYRIPTKRWYTVEMDTGISTQLPFVSEVRYEDLASGHLSYWNPGDCAWARFDVTNVGTKDSYVRFSWAESEWQEYDDDADAWIPWCPTDAGAVHTEVVDIELCESMADTGWIEDNGYFYYTNELAPGETVELCVRVCLKGPETCNLYQGKRYVLKGVFDAIQTTHDAPHHEWGVDHYGAP